MQISNRGETGTAEPVQPAGIAGYGTAADELAAQYESVLFEDVHRGVLRFFPSTISKIADIGAGTGRDAAALAELGHSVMAVEPTPELRVLGQQLHPGSAIEWVDDSLPVLAHLDGGFDLLLLTAVWMHLNAQERLDAMRRIHELLASGGRVIMSLRHGPIPPGRRMFEATAEETIDLARRFGLSPVHVGDRDDLHGRTDVRWSTVVLQRDRLAAEATAAS